MDGELSSSEESERNDMKRQMVAQIEALNSKKEEMKEHMNGGGNDEESEFSYTSNSDVQDQNVQFQDKPIQLVQLDTKKNKFIICKQGVDVLKRIDGNIGIVSFSGLYRTGKSFTLNLLLDKIGKGFAVDPTVNSCTQGLWIWGKPVKVENGNMNLVFIDTEGSGSVDRSNTHDSKIFALVVLLSSFLVYNSMGCIDEVAINNLSVAAHLSKNIAMKVKTGAKQEDLLSSITPRFLWILKDFSLELIDENKREITATEYLENCLRDNSARGKYEEMNREVRRTIITLFRSRECITLVRPVDDERDLQYLNSTSIKNLRPEYSSVFNKLKHKIFNECPRKIVGGKPMNGNMIANLLKEYVNAINKGAVPNITTAWTDIVEKELEKSFNNAKRTFQRKVQSLLKSDELPLEAEELTSLLTEYQHESNKTLESGSKFSEEASSLKKYSFQLEGIYKQAKENLETKNYQASEKFCEQLGKSLYKDMERKVEEKKYTSTQLNALETDINLLVNKYKGSSKGPAKLEYFCTFWPERLQKIHKCLASNNLAKIREIETKFEKALSQQTQNNEALAIENETLKETQHILRNRTENFDSRVKNFERNEKDYSEKLDKFQIDNKELENNLKAIELQNIELKGKTDKMSERERERQKRDAEKKKKGQKATCACFIF